MQDLEVVAPAFVAMAHRIVWCTVASVDRSGRPRSRVLHPMWEWSEGRLVGWVGTGPTPTKRAHLEASPFLSLNYWDPTQDTCVAECRAEWHFDLETRERVWDAYKTAPPPLGYDPAIIPGWESASSDAFAVLRLDPWRLRVFPGTLLVEGRGELLAWQSPD
jgi:hypothetical protein